MGLSLVAAVWLIGVCLVQQWPELPEQPLLVAAVLVTLGFGVMCLRAARIRLLGACLISLSLALTWSTALALWRLADALPDHEDDKVTRVKVLVADLPAQSDNGVRFTGVLEDAQAHGLPQRAMIFWPQACTGDCAAAIEPGQRWRMALRFRQPHGRMNFAGFDTEGWLFQQGIRASASVRGTPKWLGHASAWQPSMAIERLRSHIRKRLQRLLGDQRERNVLVALAIGDQQGVSQEDWQIFNLTGITHLVSISGSHVTLIAALGAWVVSSMYRRLRWRGRLLMERWPQRLVFVWAAGVLAFLYCLLAGWGVPAQRTFFMLAAGAIGLSARVPLTGYQAVFLAGVAMTLLDPWAVLSTGFWLSFGAMMLLVMLAQQLGVLSGRPRTRARAAYEAFVAGAKLQWIMTLAITPVTVYLFQQLSVAGLLANAWAIPWITFVATPLALLTAGLCLLPIADAWLVHLAWLAHAALWFSLEPVRWLAQFEWLSFEVHAIGVWELALGVAGVVCAMCLPPWRTRWLAWLLLLPSVSTTPTRPDVGHWSMTAFDVGQGSAILIQTRTQNLLFDTGWRYDQRDAVQAVILPELKALGVKHLDRVVISHPDMDHVGGLDRLLATRSVGQLIGSGLNRPDAQACGASQQWSVDGVRFSFIHPSDQCGEQVLAGLERNRCSCVLLVSGQWHSALLTGDIDQTVEAQLVGEIEQAIDVVLVAHHGSKTSSSQPWIDRLQAKHAVIQAGAYNRYGHPDQSVVARWQAAASTVWQSQKDGAVSFESSAAGLQVVSARAKRKRYWHRHPARRPDIE